MMIASHRLAGRLLTSVRGRSTVADAYKCPQGIKILGQKYPTDEWTNIMPKTLKKIGKNLHKSQYHPLSHVRRRIVDYFYKVFRNSCGNPEFVVLDDLSPVVDVRQNFDSLLVPEDHPSRSKTGCYYINNRTMLRAHTTAHQAELISAGLNNFLVIGDVYRRDEIDSNHYPIFHQVDGVRLCTADQLFANAKNTSEWSLFEMGGRETPQKQARHSRDAVEIMELELKRTLSGLIEHLFGSDTKMRWYEETFPFTHPSWELEVLHGENWIEVLGCGIMRQEIVDASGANDRIGWAFGLGLERLAMHLYNIPDIRTFWSTDIGFVSQFEFDDPYTPVKYKPISAFPACTLDMSFWLPESGHFSQDDFYEIVREISGELVERIALIDEYNNPKTGKTSHCYRIIYRSMERTLRGTDVNIVHERIKKAVSDRLNVVPR